MTALHLSEALLKLDHANVNAVSRLTSLMRDKDVEVRWLSAHALGAVQGELQPYAVEALRGGLRDIDSQVRATSALALGGLGDASQVAVAELSFMLEHGETNVKDAAKIALDCIQ
jgi:HEAT repeat protein